MSKPRRKPKVEELDDLDMPPLTAAELKRFRPAREVHPKLLAAMQRENAGKSRVTIRIDDQVLDWFREQVSDGGNYQTLINDALRAHITLAEGTLAATLRQVIREELGGRKKTVSKKKPARRKTHT